MLPCTLAFDGEYNTPKKFCDDVTSAILLRLSKETGISRVQFLCDAHLGGLEAMDTPKAGLPDSFSANAEIQEMNGHPYTIHGWVADVSITRSGPSLSDPENVTEGRIFFCPKE